MSENTTTRIDNSFTVHYSFPLFMTRDAFAADNETLIEAIRSQATDPHQQRVRLLVYIEASLEEYFPQLRQHIQSYTQVHNYIQLAALPIIKNGGEAIKHDDDLVDQVGQDCIRYRMCRHSCILAIGGGAFLDAIGFAAALVHRGMRLIRFPTTVLAQNDAGLGVKNGINKFGNKNFFGTFMPPQAIINDSRFLESLDDRNWRAGIAEAMKVSIIKDADFTRWICANAKALAQRDSEKMNQLILRCAQLHLQHICSNGDPFERGSARPLDFGHWSAHRLEVLSNHQLLHGEAVAIGLALDCAYAEQHGWLSKEDCEAIIAALLELGFILQHPALNLVDADGQAEILSGLEQFRQHLGGSLTLAMPQSLGRVQNIHNYDAEKFPNCLQRIKNLQRNVSAQQKTKQK